MEDYQFAKDALSPWWVRVDDQHCLDERVSAGAIRDILSLPEMPQLSENEKEVFWMVYCLMHRENRKWLSITQLALPYQELSGAKDVCEARLRSRIGLSALVDAAPHDISIKPLEQIQYRRRFLDFVSTCIPVEERKRFPFLLTLIDSHVMGTDKKPSSTSTGIDAAAWNVVNYLSTALRWLRGRASDGFKVTADTPLEVLDAHYQATLKRLENMIDEFPVMQAIKKAPPSQDSLFSKLIVHAALNRHYLETEAYQERSEELIGMQIKVFTELSMTAPEGLERALNRHSEGGRVDYLGFVKAVLPHTMTERGKSMTVGVQETIDKQADAVINSAKSEHFANEWNMNSFLAAKPLRAKSLLWVLLTWCYQQGYLMRNEDPSIKKPELPVITTKSTLFSDSSDISTLRRMLATPVFSLQWERPCPRRLELYERQNSAIRKLTQKKVANCLKGATLSQWEAGARQFLPWDTYCSMVKVAELGSLMKEYGDFQAVQLPPYENLS
jgi:hypothetical protein